AIVPVFLPQPSAVVAASLNHICDSHADLAVTNKGDNTVVILFGDGSGGFSTTNPCPGVSRAMLPIQVGQDPVAILSDDFDNNTDPGDLAGISEGGMGAAGGLGTVFVLQGDGFGDFVLTNLITVGFMPSDISSADFTADEAPEITVVNEGAGIFNGSVRVLRNNGSGGFDPLPEIPIGPAGRAVETGDLDGDADADLAVVAGDDSTAGAVLVLENITGDPENIEFDVPVAFGVGVNEDANYVVAADMNEDTALDLVTVNGKFVGSGGSVSVLLNSPPPAPCPWDCQPTSDGAVGVADFLAMLAQWGQVGTSCDFDGGGVGVTDFLHLLANFGPCP
ncbi:MAG: FG-GAP-like repeat-containing protein, partial [Planctomycetota bacterium]